jgi:hypothetical protein
MAPSLSTLVAAASNPTRPWVTGSLSPAPNALIMVITGNTGSVSDTSSKLATHCTSAFGIVGSWNIFQVADPGAVSRTSLHVWWAITSASPGSGAITINTGATPAGSSTTVKQITGVDTANPIVGLAAAPLAGTTAAGNLTLSQTPTVDDLVMSTTISRNDSGGATLGAGMTFVDNLFYANPSAGMAIQSRVGSTSTTVPYAGLNTVWNSGQAWIIKNAGSAPAPSPFIGFGVPL